jgi:hypothetical protein
LISFEIGRQRKENRRKLSEKPNYPVTTSGYNPANSLVPKKPRPSKKKVCVLDAPTITVRPVKQRLFSRHSRAGVWLLGRIVMHVKNSELGKKIRSLLAIVGTLAGLSISVNADAVSDWNAIAVQATVTGARPGPSGVLDIAMVHAAIYDGVQAITGAYEPYYVDIPNASGNPVAATAKAAHDILVNRFPAQTSALDTAYANYLIANSIPTNDPGIAVGAAAAAGIIASRACDGSFPNPAPPPFIGGTGIGEWRPTPSLNLPMTPGPWLGDVRPFVLTRTTQFRPSPPPRITSYRYLRDYNEVKAMGSINSTRRTAAQTDQAQFWFGNFVIMMNQMVRDASNANVNNISDSSRLFALADFAMADAIIACWNAKVHYNVWRPFTAIQNGDLDDNGRTVGDPSWTPLVANPPYPDYVSGANSITAAAVVSLQNFFGTDRMNVSLTTTNTGPTSQDTRSFTSLSDVAQEVVDARILLGIHFRFADEAARTLGTKVADWGYQHYLQPTYGDGQVAALRHVRRGTIFR